MAWISTTLRRIATAPSSISRLRRERVELGDEVEHQTSEVQRLRTLVRTLRTQKKDILAKQERLSSRVDKQAAEIVRLRGMIADMRRADAYATLPDDVAQTVDRVRSENLTMLSLPAITGLAQTLLAVETAGVPGLVIEAGTARGGSAIVLAATKSPGRRLRVYDVFGMIPAPSENDGDDVHRRYEIIRTGKVKNPESYYGYQDNLYDEVRSSFSAHGRPVEENQVELIKGLFQDTIDIDEPVAFAHLDGDWYESTMTCLERIAPHLAIGGRLVIDDYYYWSGCRTAVDEYFAGRPEFELIPGVRLHVARREVSPSVDEHDGELSAAG